MAKLLVLADDMTGAVDTGVQFAALGVSVFVSLRGESDGAFGRDAEVLVVNTCSRHLPPDAAYRLVRDISANALRHGVRALYKKTDSGLRGNIGAELQAVMDAAGGETIAFVPAYPKLRRTLRGGVLYVDGQPVTASVFGSDLFTPVRHDCVADIIAEQSSVPVTQGDAPSARGAIWLLDAQTDADMIDAARRVAAHKEIRVLAGCAGFAAFLPDLMGMRKRTAEPLRIHKRFIVVSGSVSEVSLTQLSYARGKGYACFTPGGTALYQPDFLAADEGQRVLAGILQALSDGRNVLVDVAGSAARVMECIASASAMGLELEEARARVARNLGALASAVLRADRRTTLGVFGGDTLQEVLLALDCTGITPLCEIESGVVCSMCHTPTGDLPLISKSGNFGDERLFDGLNRFLAEHGEEPSA